MADRSLKPVLDELVKATRAAERAEEHPVNAVRYSDARARFAAAYRKAREMIGEPVIGIEDFP